MGWCARDGWAVGWGGGQASRARVGAAQAGRAVGWLAAERGERGSTSHEKPRGTTGVGRTHGDVECVGSSRSRADPRGRGGSTMRSAWGLAVDRECKCVYTCWGAPIIRYQRCYRVLTTQMGRAEDQELPKDVSSPLLCDCCRVSPRRVVCADSPAVHTIDERRVAQPASLPRQHREPQCDAGDEARYLRPHRRRERSAAARGVTSIAGPHAERQGLGLDDRADTLPPDEGDGARESADAAQDPSARAGGRCAAPPTAPA